MTAPDPAGSKPNDHRREIADALSLMTQIGVSMFACVFVGIMLGKTLDQWFGTTPVLLLLGSLLGGIASFKALYDLAIKKWMK